MKLGVCAIEIIQKESQTKKLAKLINKMGYYSTIILSYLKHLSKDFILKILCFLIMV